MESGRTWVKRGEAVMGRPLVWSAWSGCHQRRPVARNRSEGLPDLEKKGALVVIFDEARVWEHLGTTGSVSPPSIWQARHYSGLSTVILGAAAMVTVARAIYGLIFQSKRR